MQSAIHHVPLQDVVSGPPIIVIARLRRFELFAPLSNAELGEIARSCREIAVEAGTTLIHQGQVGDDVYLLEEGLVSVFREKQGEMQMLAIVDPPSVVGEMAIVTPERIRTASVKALSDLRLIALGVMDMKRFLRQFPSLNQSLREILSRRGFGK